MTKEQIEKSVKEVISERLNVKIELLTPKTNVIDDLGADSLDTVDLLQKLEERFEISIPDKDMEKITTISSAVDYFEKRLPESTPQTNTQSKSYFVGPDE